MATVGWILNRNLKFTLLPEYLDFTEKEFDPDVYLQVVKYPHSFEDNFEDIVNEFLNLKNAYLAPVGARGMNDRGDRYAVILVNHTRDFNWVSWDDDGMTLATAYVVNSAGTVTESNYMSFKEIRKLYDPSIEDQRQELSDETEE